MLSDDKLQEGIHFRPGEAPPPFFRFVTFNFKKNATPKTAHDALDVIWKLLGELKTGNIRDLRATRSDDPEITVNAGCLSVLLCYGHRLFNNTDRQVSLVSEDWKPDEIPIIAKPPASPFTAMEWRGLPEALPDVAQTDFAIQLTATTELAVVRPIVEVQKLIDDLELPVQIVYFFSGLHRDDRRSWIDFHDGVNNMRSEDRLQAIEVDHTPQDWLLGGTTLTFLKIAIDMQGWRRLSREQQEAIVGRDKLSGIPITEISVEGDTITLSKLSGCPMQREIGIGEGWPDKARDPDPIAGLAKTSHIHRSNLLRQSPSTEATRRIYRQGYEFVDSPPMGGMRLGLNFVGFQKDANTVLNILRNPNWLGDANFGGIKNNSTIPAFKLMSLIAGGTFAVPPLSNTSFPGSVLFSSLS
jgi:deferrochelatase/peroxidase EfeB